MSTAAKVGAVIASVGGALLAFSLLLSWWGPPPALINPPADLPGELELFGESIRQDPIGLSRDAFEFFEFRDILWLATAIAGLVLGLASLSGLKFSTPLAVVGTALAAIAVILIVITLIAPPDLIEINEERGVGFGVDYDLPLGREVGGWVALAASLAILGGALLLTLRGQRR